MKKLRECILVMLAAISISFACQRTTSNEIPVIDLKGIPAEYGSLVSVTTHAEYPGWAQLWFEDDKKTIRMIRIEFQKQKIISDPLTIPRN